MEDIQYPVSPGLEDGGSGRKKKKKKEHVGSSTEGQGKAGMEMILGPRAGGLP